jgi:hypothetical protein
MGSSEGNKLHDVLTAKDALAWLPVANAYEAVLQDLRSRQKRDATIDTQVLLNQAIAALDGLVSSFAQPPAASSNAIRKSLSAAR